MRLTLAAIALCLSACAAPLAAPASTPPPQTVEVVTVRATQGLILAELAYNTAAETVQAGVRTGLIRPGTPLAVRLRALNRSASTALEAARRARSGVEQAAAVTRATQAVLALSSSTPGGK